MTTISRRAGTEVRTSAAALPSSANGRFDSIRNETVADCSSACAAVAAAAVNGVMLSLTSTTTALATRAFHAATRPGVITIGCASATTARPAIASRSRSSIASDGTRNRAAAVRAARTKRRLGKGTRAARCRRSRCTRIGPTRSPSPTKAPGASHAITARGPRRASRGMHAGPLQAACRCGRAGSRCHARRTASASAKENPPRRACTLARAILGLPR